MEENNQTTLTPVKEPKVSATTHTHETHTTGRNPVMGGFWERLGAYVVDSFIISIVTSPVNFMIGGFRMGATSMVSNNSNPQDLSAALGIMSGLMGLSSLLSIGLYLAAAYFYFGYFYSTKGQTPGKMLLKLKVVKASDLSFLDYNAAFLRDGLMKIVSSFLVYLGFFWYFATPKRQTWHDLVAHTYVVKTNDNGDILMNGPEYYSASKAKAFAFPCGCCLLYLLMIVAAVVLMIGAAGSSATKVVKQQMEVDQQQMQEQQYNDLMNSLEGEYNGSEMDREDVQDQMNQMNQQQMQMLQEMNEKQMNQMMEDYRNTPQDN